MNKIVTVSKAQQLYSILKADILAGRFDEQEKLPSIRELAIQYGLSKNTANTVIAMLVNDGLVQVREGNGTYINRSREKKKPRMIGVLMLDFACARSNRYVDGAILSSVQQHLTGDYFLSLANTDDCCDVFCDSVERLLDMGAAGFLVIPPKNAPRDEAELQRMQRLISQRPTVFMNRAIPGVEADLYSIDLRKGIEDAFEYLATTGKRKIAILLHDSAKFVEEELEAYEQMSRLYGLEKNADYLIEYSKDEAVLRQKISRVLPEIDALIAPDNELVALSDLYQASGKRIPQELSLIGINDMISARLFNPPLTTISFPVKRIGKEAIAKLIGRIEGTDDSQPKARNFAPDFIIRST